MPTALSEIELARHPTLGEGNPDSEPLDESRTVVNTSKMEVDMLNVLKRPLKSNPIS